MNPQEDRERSRSPVRVSILNPPVVQQYVSKRKRELNSIQYKIGDVIDRVYHITRELGKGGFGKTYAAVSSMDMRPYAVKVTRDFDTWQTEKTMYENIVSSPHAFKFAFYYCSGTCAYGNYLLIELLGPNLETIMLGSPQESFTPNTKLRLFPLLLESVLCLHSLGLVHSDIKPVNFVARDFNPSRQHCKFVLIDFGLTTRFELFSSESEIPRIGYEKVRGTVTYASPYAHVYNKLSYRDDLWSLFYSFVTLSGPILPWEYQKMKNSEAFELKRSCNYEALLKYMTVPCWHFYHFIKHLKHDSIPHHGYLRSLLYDSAAMVNQNSLWEWEQNMLEEPRLGCARGGRRW